MNINKASASGLVRVAEKYFVEKNSSLTSFQGCTYDFTTNTNTCDGLEFTGEKPKNGRLRINSDGKVEMAVQIDDKCYIKNYDNDDISFKDYSEQSCNYIKKIGEEYIISGEPFLVIGSNSEETTLIAKYNLLAGYICTGETTCTAIDSSTLGYGRQNSSVLGYAAEYPTNGTIAFSSENYWRGKIDNSYNNFYNEYINRTDDPDYDFISSEYTLYIADVYDSNNNLKSINENYKLILNADRQIVKEIRLMTYKEARSLGCILTSDDTCPIWLSNSAYWLGTAYNDSAIYNISMIRNRITGSTYSYNSRGGIRPVIVVNTSDI